MIAAALACCFTSITNVLGVYCGQKLRDPSLPAMELPFGWEPEPEIERARR